MSTSSARSHATRAQQTSDTTEKLDEIAKAIYELARAIDDVEKRVKRIPA
jgi:hypothetical protein